MAAACELGVKCRRGMWYYVHISNPLSRGFLLLSFMVARRAGIRMVTLRLASAPLSRPLPHWGALDLCRPQRQSEPLPCAAVEV